MRLYNTIQSKARDYVEFAVFTIFLKQTATLSILCSSVQSASIYTKPTM